MTKDKFKAALKSFGLPRLIIAGFLLLLLIMAPFVGADLPTQISNIINRFSWNGILVLAMVPMVHSGCGLNFGLPLGIISGLLGATLSIELGFTGPLSFLAAILIATPFALVLGALYGWLLNKIKGGEMMIATYVGFSSVSLMCMMWLILPYHSPNMVWGLSGKGLRTTISLEGYYIGALAKIGQINIGAISIPTGTLLFFALLAFAIWAFLHTKTGTAPTRRSQEQQVSMLTRSVCSRSSCPLGWRQSESWSMSRDSASFSCTWRPSIWRFPPYPQS